MDRLEDKADRAEDRFDRKENVRDKAENKFDRREDRRDSREDVRDRKENLGDKVRAHQDRGVRITARVSAPAGGKAVSIGRMPQCIGKINPRVPEAASIEAAALQRVPAEVAMEAATGADSLIR